MVRRGQMGIITGVYAGFPQSPLWQNAQYRGQIWGKFYRKRGQIWGIIGGKRTANFKKKGQDCINMEFKNTKIPGQQKCLQIFSKILQFLSYKKSFIHEFHVQSILWRMNRDKGHLSLISHLYDTKIFLSRIPILNGQYHFSSSWVVP